MSLFKKSLIKILFCSCICSYIPMLAWEEVKDLAEVKILTPGLNDRKIGKIKLKNGLEAYLISDPDTKESSAALTVNVGSWDEPRSMPGLAHFLEHMLFLGTKKYPVESEFHTFVSAHKGQSNAFTYNDITSFMFSATNDGFKEGLDRFSSFFKEPLFNSSGVNREVKAIDQEWKVALQSDDRLSYLVLKELANPDHPFSGFNIGNEQSLANVSQEALKNWYQTEYSAEKMRLFVLSNLELESLKQLVEKDFEEIPVRIVGNQEESSFKKLGPIFGPKALGQLITVEPIQEKRSLSLIWELPASFAKWKDEKPWSLLCSIMGDEGKGSALEYLKNQGLAEGLSCGELRLTAQKSLFLIDIDLSQKGVEEKEKVIKSIFQALDKVRAEGFSKERFDENVGLDQLRYQWTQAKDAYSEASDNAFTQGFESLDTYPERSSIVHTYDSTKLDELLKIIVPENAIYMLTASEENTHLKYKLKEKWSQVSYDVAPLDMSQFKNLPENKEISLPRPNEFVPTKFELLNKDPEEFSKIPTPKLVVEDVKGKVYFLKDTLYDLPKIYWSFEILTPEVKSGSPQSFVINQIYLNALNERLSQMLYEAKIAGLEVTIEAADEGIVITFSGWKEKARYLLEKIISELPLTNLSEEKFRNALQKVERKYRNILVDSPLKQGAELFRETIWTPSVSLNQKIDAVRSINFEKFQASLKKLYTKNYLQSLMIGSMEESEAKQIFDLWQKGMAGSPYPKEDQVDRDIIGWPETANPTAINRKSNSSGSAFILAIQDTEFSFKKRAAQQIISQSLEKNYFAELRTKQQTGYINFMMGEEIDRTLFFNFLIQSSTHVPEELLWRTESFIEQYLQELQDNVSEDQFNQAKVAFLQQLKQKPKALEEMGALLTKLAFDYEDLNWVAERIQGMETLTYPEFLTIVKNTLGRSNHRRLAIFIEGINDAPFKYENRPSPKSLKNFINNLIDKKKLSKEPSSKIPQKKTFRPGFASAPSLPKQVKQS